MDPPKTHDDGPMPTVLPQIGWARDVGFTLLVVCVLILILSGIFLFLVARDWADAKTPWFGRAVLAVAVTVAGVRIVRELVTPARSRTRSAVVAAGIVVMGWLAAIYFGLVRPALRDHERDTLFASRIAEQRAVADGIEAIARDLPDPAVANRAEIAVALWRAREQLAQVPELDPESLGREEYERYTDAQKVELTRELTRATAAMREFRERHAALRAVLDKKKDKP